MTGLRPDQTQVFDLVKHFRETQPEVVTLPELFRQSGWKTARVGKIYHYNVPAGIGTDGLDDPLSWDQVVNPRGRDVQEEALITNPTPQKAISAALSWLAAEGTDEEQTDGMVAGEGIRLMRSFGEEPFFLGVGFFRPHTPYVAPQKYFQLYPLETIRLPWSPLNDREDIPGNAFAHNCLLPHYNLSEQTCREALRAYLACVSFVDAQVGRLLNAVEELELKEKTIVVFWSDHGYHLGEHQGVWQKRCLFEESARIPFLVRVPGMSGNGRSCDRVVEMIDLYPTLADVCGLTIPIQCQGHSLRPLLEDPQSNWEQDAVTQILRPGVTEPVMGRTLRTQQWRYTEWNGGEGGRELYDHTIDPQEHHNLESRVEYQNTIEALREKLNLKAQPLPPKAGFVPEKL